MNHSEARRATMTVSGSRPARILVVDDEAPHMAALCDTLSERGFTTEGFASPQEALGALRAREFDLLLTDLMMPDMDGIELLRAAQGIQPDLVGVLMTGHATIDTAVEAMKVGALDYVVKPFRLSAVLPVLSRALTLRQLRLEKAALEEGLRQRTAELEIANHDLEAFSFSVSHDLMAPVRAIRGYSEILSQEHASQLPETARMYLKRVLDSSVRMQALIRDLLQFARLGRLPVKKKVVDMGSLVREVVQALEEQNPERRVDIRLATLERAYCDPSLLRQVFTNLLSNAFKFTRNNATALIEIESQLSSEGVSFIVRDNGAGFDMEFASKLFAAFQRLHSESEFEGSGIGLSTVQRIIERHGGRIWAEGAVGKGATFAFSLPGEPDIGA